MLVIGQDDRIGCTFCRRWWCSRHDVAGGTGLVILVRVLVRVRVTLVLVGHQGQPVLRGRIV